MLGVRHFETLSRSRQSDCVTCTFTAQWPNYVVEIDGTSIRHRTKPYTGQGPLVAMKGLAAKFSKRCNVGEAWVERIGQTKFFRIHFHAGLSHDKQKS